MPTIRNAHVSMLQSWAHDFEKFCTDVFDAKLTSQQKIGAKAITDLVWAKIRVNTNGPNLTDEEKRLSKKTGISIMSGTGTGKGAICAMFIQWFMTCFPFPKMPCTGPSGHSIKDNLWSELAKWHGKSKIKDWFVWQSDKFYLREHGGKEWFAVARTTNPKGTADEQAETLAGFHSDYLAVVVDEASGVPDPVFRPLEGTLTGRCNFIFMIFNPTKSKGFAVESHRKFRDEWVCIRWNSEESEIVTRESIERLAKKYGKDSNTYRIRVLGLPPSTSDQTVIPYEWITDAVDRELEPREEDPLLFSLDVGAGGDDSVLLRAQGPLISQVENCNYESSERLVDWISQKIITSEPKIVLVDNNGVGWGIPDAIRKRVRGPEIRGVNVSESAFDDQRFYRLRDELWWKTRERFERGIISIPDDALLIGDLNAPRYDDSKGVIKIESKKEMKSRGIESPNRADALIQTALYEHDMLVSMAKAMKKSGTSRSKNQNWKTQ
jgi:phage terminase large subunit